MKEIKLSQKGKNKGKYVALVDDEDYEYLNQWKWHVQQQHGNLYAVRRNSKYNDVNVIMHRTIFNVCKSMVIDHIDHNGLNNQKSNLRKCVISENARNRVKRKNKSSVYKGVSYHIVHKRWIAQVRLNYKLFYIGLYETEEKAARAYDKKAKELHGEYANLNFR